MTLMNQIVLRKLYSNMDQGFRDEEAYEWIDCRLGSLLLDDIVLLPPAQSIILLS